MSETAAEQALYATCEADLASLPEGVSRIYHGHEFCERLLPSRRELSRMVGLAERRGLAFTLLTPYVSERGLERVRRLLGALKLIAPRAEVVFNDWGVLRIVEEEFGDFEPVLGRLLIKMKRGPRLASLAGAFNASTARYFRTCSLDVPLYRRFLRARGISRVELDNVLQGIDLDLSATELRGSLYVPFGYIATTRMCLAAGCGEHGMEDHVGVFPCRKECRAYTFELQARGEPVPQIRKGNTIFFENAKRPDGIVLRGVDRIVTEPRLPF